MTLILETMTAGLHSEVRIVMSTRHPSPHLSMLAEFLEGHVKSKQKTDEDIQNTNEDIDKQIAVNKFKTLLAGETGQLTAQQEEGK